MCLFHKWRQIKKAVVNETSYSLFLKEYVRTTKILIIEECAKCGKKRAYVYPPCDIKDKQEVDVFYAEQIK